jgi:hypothetical protein
MKRIEWNEEKNELLKKTRNICFEDFVDKISEGHYKLMENNRQNQKTFVIEHNDYPYCVPFGEEDKKIFLKTIFPNRKLKNRE